MTAAMLNKALLYGVSDAAKVLGIGRSTVWSLIAAGQLEVVHIGRRTLVKHASIQKLAEQGVQLREDKKSPARNGAKQISDEHQQQPLNSSCT